MNVQTGGILLLMPSPCQLKKLSTSGKENDLTTAQSMVETMKGAAFYLLGVNICGLVL